LIVRELDAKSRPPRMQELREETGSERERGGPKQPIGWKCIEGLKIHLKDCGYEVIVDHVWFFQTIALAAPRPQGDMRRERRGEYVPEEAERGHGR
jgi:hypothetical protein